ncbi:CoA-transferase family III domain-containing protein [Pyronema omphalodes]|nr:CoA-transferase family III domain-containing protein [Pyronema omphalodes]
MAYSTITGAKDALEHLLNQPENRNLPLPQAAIDYARKTKFTGRDSVFLPCVMKEVEASAALKAIEAGMAAAIGELRYGWKEEDIEVNMERAGAFLFMAYLASVDGLTKLNKEVRSRLRDTDFNRAQSNIYRRLSANLYKTKDNGYYHIHGSLAASPALEMIGLPTHREDFTDEDYPRILEYIGEAVAKFTVAELEELNNERKLAGIMAIKKEEFEATPHGQALQQQPYWQLQELEKETPPVPFAPAVEGEEKPQILKGIRVLELCRIIAGPTVTRILAEYGAEVLKITSPTGPDVPFFQVDGNIGKHCAELDLKTPEGRKIFEELLATADVVVDGYRPGAIEKLGFGPGALKELAKKRGKGYVYVNENCFGYDAPMAHRAGWQQIADCVSGLAWAQGQAMGRDEPIIPPFPMSDYGTGCMGAISALTGLYHRAQSGGSYWGKASLIQYDMYLMSLSPYTADVWKPILDAQDPAFSELRYYDSVDHIGKTALKGLKQIAPWYWNEEEDQYLQEFECQGFGGKIKIVRPVVKMGKTKNGFNETSRPNGWDKPEWWTGEN